MEYEINLVKDLLVKTIQEHFDVSDIRFQLRDEWHHDSYIDFMFFLDKRVANHIRIKAEHCFKLDEEQNQSGLFETIKEFIDSTRVIFLEKGLDHMIKSNPFSPTEDENKFLLNIKLLMKKYL